MGRFNSAAAAAGKSKRNNPVNYCTYRDCLWRTYDARSDSWTACGNHGANYLHPDAVKREDAPMITDDDRSYERSIETPDLDWEFDPETDETERYLWLFDTPLDGGKDLPF